MSTFREAPFAAPAVELNVASGPPQGPPLVLLHGVVRRWQDFLPIATDLASRWQLHGIDHRGHGRSGRAAQNYRVADYAGDATAFVERGIDQPAVIYGHSLGAMVALAAAAAAPDRVRALVLEDPPCETLGTRIEHTTYPEMFAAWRNLAETQAGVPELAARMADVVLTSHDGIRVRIGDVRDATSLRFTASCLSQLDPRVLDPLVAGTWYEGYSLDALLPRVKCPVLILQSDASAGGMLSDDDAERLLRGLSDATRIRFPDVGHLIHWEAPELALRHVLAFLESL